MKTIYINGKAIKVSATTFRRIEHIASSEKLTFAEAVKICLQRVK